MVMGQSSFIQKHVCNQKYLVSVEQGHLPVFQMFPKAGSGGWHQTLEALPILWFHRNGVFLKGGDRPAAGVQRLQGSGMAGMGGGAKTNN